MSRELSTPEDRAAQLLERATKMRLAGRLSQAERAVAQASGLLEKNDVRSDLRTTTHLWRALLAEDRGRHELAASAYAAALRELGRLGRREAESRLLLRLQAMRGVARAARDLGQLTACGQRSARTLSLARARFGNRHMITAMVLVDLGVLRKAQGRYDEALAAYREALPIVLRAEGADGYEAATLYHNLGGIEHARNKLARAERWARKSVKVRRALLGSHDVAVAADEAALAAVLEGRNKFQEAFALYRHSRAVFRRKQGSASPEVAYSLANTAALLQRWGRAREAERHYRQAIPLLRRTLGPQHAQLALTLSNYGVLLCELGRAREGVRYVEQACAIAAATLPARHPQRRLYEYNRKHLSRPS